MASKVISSRVYLRVSDITCNRITGRSGLLPVTASTWWAWVKSGKAPAPIKLSPGCTVWRHADVIAFAESLAKEAEE